MPAPDDIGLGHAPAERKHHKYKIFINQNDLDIALSHYAAAETAFVQASCLRGQGAIHLRKGCLMLIKVMNELSPLMRDGSMNDASHYFDQAIHCFEQCGDSLQSRLCAVLKSLMVDLDQEAFKAASHMAKKAALGRSSIFDHYTALLVHNFGNFCRHRRGAFTWAARANEWAWVIVEEAIQSPLCDVSSSLRLLLIQIALSHLDASLYIGGESAQGCSNRLEKHIGDFCEDFVRHSQSPNEEFSQCCRWILIQYMTEYMGLHYRLSHRLGHLSQSNERRIRYASGVLKAISVPINGFNAMATSEEYLNFRVGFLRSWAKWKSLLTKNGWDDAACCQRREHVERAFQLLNRTEFWPDIFADSASDDIHLAGNEIPTIILLERYGMCPPVGSTSTPNWIPNAEWYTYRGWISRAESYLEISLNAKCWSYATQLFEFLDKVTGGYTDFHCISRQWVWRRLFWAALIQDHLSNPEQAFNHVIASIEIVAKARLHDLGLIGDRTSFFAHPDIPRLFNLAAKILIQACARGQPLEGLRLEDYHIYALWYLERGKALSVLELATINDEDRETFIENAERSHKWAVLMQLRQLQRPLTEAELTELTRLNADFETLQWHRDFMPVRDLSSVIQWPSQLFESIADDSLIIYTSASIDGMSLLCIDANGISQAIFNTEISSTTLDMHSNELVTRLRNKRQDADFSTLVNDQLIPLSLLLTEPFKDQIKAKKHIIFVPCGALDQIPLNALICPVPEGVFNGNTFLGISKGVSQTASLSFYHYLRTRDANRLRASDISVIARPGSLKEELSGGETALPLAGIEALFVSSMFNLPLLRAEKQTRSSLIEQLEQYDIVHVATHGYVDQENPLFSRISLGEDFRVIDMLKARTKASLIVLSACHTGAGQFRASDYMVGFPHAILAAGANALLGSLWATNDLATLIHMFWFYSLLIFFPREESVAYIWARATRRLCYSTTQEVKEILEQLQAAWEKWESHGLQPESVVRRGKKELQRAIDSLWSADGQPMITWKHPYIWASFMMFGNGDIDRKVIAHRKELNEGSDQLQKAGVEVQEESDRE